MVRYRYALEKYACNRQDNVIELSGSIRVWAAPLGERQESLFAGNYTWLTRKASNLTVSGFFYFFDTYLTKARLRRDYCCQLWCVCWLKLTGGN